MSDYKPTEHGGLKKDGTPDKRVGTGGSSILSPSLATYSNDIVQSLLKARSTLMRQASKVARPLDQDQDQDQVNLVTLVAAPRAVSAPESPILSHTLIQ
jgi:hypothetical protein